MRISIYKSSDDRIPIDKATGGETDPILWCRDGEYCVIPTEVVQNALDLHEQYEQLLPFKITPPELYFYWSQGIQISNQAGRALVGK